MCDRNQYAILKTKYLFVSALRSVSQNYRQADVVVLLVVLSCLLTYFAVGGYYVNVDLNFRN